MAKFKKVTMKTRYAGDFGCCEPGKTIALPADEAKRVIDAGYAEEADDDARTVADDSSLVAEPGPKRHETAVDETAEDAAAARVEVETAATRTSKPKAKK